MIKQGRVHGGQQPISGATIQLYAVGSAGDGSASTPLLTQVVTTDSGGNFAITNDYTCPSASSLVYLVATGGNPGFSNNVTNPALAMMTALGQCGALSPTTQISVNELTTVAVVWSLAPFMTSYSNVGSGSGDASELAEAFTLATELVDPTTGSAPGLNVPTGFSVPLEQLNLLADILATCVNSAGGTVGDGSPCGYLFRDSTPLEGIAPTNVISAGLNFANGEGVDDPFSLVTPQAPYQPTPAYVPTDYLIHLSPVSSSPLLYLTTNPTSVWYSDTVVSASSQQGIGIFNQGTSTVVINGISIIGPDAADFTLTNNVCPASLPPMATSPLGAGSCGVQVIFTPLATGTRNATVRVSSSASNSPLAIPLTGHAVPSTPPIGPGGSSPNTLNFYQPGDIQLYTFTNTQSTPITISAINISPANWTQMNTCGTVVDAQASCMIAVVAGISNGEFNGTMTVVDGNSVVQQTVQLVSDIRALSGPVIRFGLPGGNYPPHLNGGVYSYTANGSDYYTYSGTLSGPNPGDFSLTPSTCTVQTTQGAPPVTCALSINSRPTATGFRIAYLTTNAGETYLLKDVGKGTSPGYIFWPPAVVFGTQPLGSSTTLGFEIDDTTTISTVLNPMLITVSSGTANNGDFVFYNCVSARVGGTCYGSVKFTPQALGTRFAVITYTDQHGLQQSLLAIGTGSAGP